VKAFSRICTVVWYVSLIALGDLYGGVAFALGAAAGLATVVGAAADDEIKRRRHLINSEGGPVR
jgi:hypothetical protein